MGCGLQKIVAPWGEAVDKASGFQANAAVHGVGGDNEAIAGPDIHEFAINAEPIPPAFHEGRLNVDVVMECAFSAFSTEVERDDHQLGMVGQDLTGHVFSGFNNGELGHGCRSFHARFSYLVS
jgi:hypothetical protein